jgi:hypothetical protein
MDPFKQTIKQALDEHVYKPIELDEKGKREFFSQLQHSKPITKRRRDYSKAAALLAGLCAVIILFIITVPFFQKSNIRSSDLQKQIHDEFGKNVIIPMIKDTRLLLVTIVQPNTAHKELNVTYGMDTGEKVYVSDEARKMEEEKQFKIVYGPKNGKPVIMLRYYNGDLRSEQYPDSQTINDFPVFTQKRIVNDRSFYEVEIQVQKGYYELQIEMNAAFTEEKLKQLLDQFTLQLKNKY